MFIVGHSMGAMQATAAALADPRLYAAVAALGGGGAAKAGAGAGAAPLLRGGWQRGFRAGRGASLDQGLARRGSRETRSASIPTSSICWSCRKRCRTFFASLTRRPGELPNSARAKGGLRRVPHWHAMIDCRNVTDRGDRPSWARYSGQRRACRIGGRLGRGQRPGGISLDPIAAVFLAGVVAQPDVGIAAGIGAIPVQNNYPTAPASSRARAKYRDRSGSTAADPTSGP